MIDELPEVCACGAPLVWALTERGIAVPLDAAPVDGGGLHAAGMAAYLGRIRPVVRSQPDGRMRSHFARGACPIDRPPNYKASPGRRRRAAVS